MNTKKLIIFLVITITSTSARILTQSAVSALQNILSSPNTERAMQMMKMAGLRSNRYAPQITRATCDGTNPVRFAYEIPRTIANEMPIRFDARAGNPEMQKIRQGELSTRVGNTAVIRQVPSDVYARVGNDIQKIIQRDNAQYYVNPMVSKVSGQEMQPCPPAYNPYLPAASPISAMSPGNLPPPTQSRGQFLKKIPIPPPT